MQLTKSVYQKTKDNLDWLAFEEKETLSPDGEIKIKLTLDLEEGLCLKIWVPYDSYISSPWYNLKKKNQYIQELFAHPKLKHSSCSSVIEQERKCSKYKNFINSDHMYKTTNDYITWNKPSIERQMLLTHTT